MLDAPVSLGHVLGDLAAEADDLDRFVGARRARPARRNRAAVIEQIGVEVRVAEAVAGGLHLRKVDAEIAGAGADGGGGEDVRAARFLVRDFRFDARAVRGRWRWLRRLIDRNDRHLLGLLGGRLNRAVSKRPFFLAVVDRLRSAVRARGLDHRQHGADRHLVADFAGELDHLAGDRAFHLDRRLVGHHVGDLLVLGDRVADLDVPGDDLGLGNAFADVGQLEFVPHQSAITFSRAFFMRLGPGK